jgi:hypothetical protein
MFGFGCGCGSGDSSGRRETRREVITREVVLIPCQYCGGLMPQTAIFCPNCGARRKN